MTIIKKILYFEVKVKNKVNIHLICHLNDDIRSLKGRLKEKSSRQCYIFLRAIFCPKKKNENVCLGKKAPLSTISFERSILEKKAESRPPLFFNFRGGLLSIIFPKKHSKCLKTAIS